MVRIRPDARGCVAWLLYRADWIYVQEPPRISKWDIHFENQWDQVLHRPRSLLRHRRRGEAHRGLGRRGAPHQPAHRRAVLARRRQRPADRPPDAALGPRPRLPLPRDRRQRRACSTRTAGTSRTSRPSRPTGTRTSAILGTRADKWLKAVIFECDTFGADKQVQIEVDGTVVETLTVNTNGRRVVQLALTEQAPRARLADVPGRRQPRAALLGRAALRRGAVRSSIAGRRRRPTTGCRGGSTRSTRTSR